MQADRQLFKQLSKICNPPTIIVGIGNTLKGDDGAGPLVCERLKNAKVSAELIDAGTVPENYIQKIIKKEPRTLLVIDAIDFGDEAGTIKILEPGELNSHVISTHTLSPRLFTDMIRQSIQVGVYFVGIQPAHTRLGEPVSAAVNLAIEQLGSVIAEIFPPLNNRQ